MRGWIITVMAGFILLCHSKVCFSVDKMQELGLG